MVGPVQLSPDPKTQIRSEKERKIPPVQGGHHLQPTNGILHLFVVNHAHASSFVTC